MAEPPIFTLQSVRLTFGGNDLFTDVDLALAASDRVALVGRNGSGKSTLLKVMEGRTAADGGDRWIQPGVSMAYLEQEPDLTVFETAKDAVMAAVDGSVESHGYLADIYLDALNIDADAETSALSGGQGRRVALAAVFAAQPDILLLDEPTNHLDIATIEWLEKELSNFAGAVVIISHDRRFLNNVTRRCFWLDRGFVRSLDQGFDAFDDWSSKILEQELTEAHKLKKLIAREMVWMRQGVTARRKRNQGRLRRLHDLRAEAARERRTVGSMKVELEEGPQSGRRVIEAKSIAKSFDGVEIIQPFSFKVMRGDRIGFVGPNGVGKSTLLKMLVKTLVPDSGTVKHGTNISLTYLDQGRSSLDPDKSLWETLADIGGDQIMVAGVPRHVVTYLRDFLFEDRQARQPVAALSGGERNRLLLAKHLANPTNLLVLDEPTNDLDMDTLDLLQELLSEFDGTLLLVSHDRDFLDRIVNKTLWFEPGKPVMIYAGGYSDALAQRREVQPDQKANGASKAKIAAREKQPAASSQFTYAEELKRQSLPVDIANLESKLERMEARLATPNLYTTAKDEFDALVAAVAKTKEEISLKEEEWLLLEERAEEGQA